MLRLILDWFSSNPDVEHNLSFATTDKWYSEALLPSAFLARYRGDKLAESWTHADGVIGDFIIGVSQRGDLSLKEDACRFIVTEAKMFSKLSSGVKNASYFNQAARNIACIAELISRAQIPPASFDKISFFVIAPESQINDGIFAELMAKDKIREIVNRRVLEYQNSEKDKWFKDWFLPTLEQVQICQIPWEELILIIIQSDPEYGRKIDEFYAQCVRFNQKTRNTFMSLSS
ncbi:MAG: hypothetical protein GY729_19385 [Desulfobacteraceae bacterium]|nr:hypothetical protein [Desulfobacteraceae bacterium]